LASGSGLGKASPVFAATSVADGNDGWRRGGGPGGIDGVFLVAMPINVGRWGTAGFELTFSGGGVTLDASGGGIVGGRRGRVPSFGSTAAVSIGTRGAGGMSGATSLLARVCSSS
jgi:hypothetical protein